MLRSSSRHMKRAVSDTAFAAPIDFHLSDGLQLRANA